MEVLEYPLKFGVQLTTFRGSTNTETLKYCFTSMSHGSVGIVQKIDFEMILIDVCVCMCGKVCQSISFKYVD